MESEDKVSSTNKQNNDETSCLSVQSINLSGSGSDENGEDPPFSFSIHTEHQLLPEKSEQEAEMNASSVTSDNTSPNQDRDDEMEEEEEQPPVTWFVTKPSNPTYNQAPNTYNYSVLLLITMHLHILSLSFVRCSHDKICRTLVVLLVMLEII